MQALIFPLWLAVLLASHGRVLAPAKHRAGAPAAARHKASYPPAELYAVNLNESMRYRPFDDAGHPRKNADRELTHFLRCWHTGKQHRVDNRLGRALYQVARHFPGHRLEIFSGFRPKKYCTREHSRHLTASAIDFHVAGVKNEALIGWLRATFHPAGVGYYPNGVHVHLDLDRARDTYWIDSGDTPAPKGDVRPLSAIGDTAPDALEATSDEPVEMMEPSEPPSGDPAIPE